MTPTLVELLPTRTRRNYRGGLLLDRMQGGADAADGNQPEDWLASTTPARNPGMPPVADEGLTPYRLPNGRTGLLRDLLAEHADDLLGCAMAGLPRRASPEPTQPPELGFLAKLLDAAVRLQVQAHPTAAFAREHLGSPWGKFESYVILGVRPGVDPYIRLGFQRAPSPAEWKRIVLEQDIAAMDRCFDRVPVRVGEVWIVPGGLPHALGEGLLVLEVMEPSDLVVRCEFGSGDMFVPPEARFMGRDPDLALRLFDYTSYSVEEITRRCRLEPRLLADEASHRREKLIDAGHTPCFQVERLTVPGACELPTRGMFQVALVIQGRGTVRSGSASLALRPGSRCFVAAGAETVKWEAAPGEALEVLLCQPAKGG